MAIQKPDLGILFILFSSFLLFSNRIGSFSFLLSNLSFYSKDELLTNVMIYWWSRSAASAARLYYETEKKGRFGPPRFKVHNHCTSHFVPLTLTCSLSLSYLLSPFLIPPSLFILSLNTPLITQVDQPTAVAVFPKEILRPPQRWAGYFYNVKRWTKMDYGGHFPALENPQSLINDLRGFFFEDLTLHQTLDFLPKY